LTADWGGFDEPVADRCGIVSQQRIAYTDVGKEREQDAEALPTYSKFGEKTAKLGLRVN
jgi:hypothetical protein